MSNAPQGSLRCPLCGRTNDCAMAQGADDASTCWCNDARIPAEALTTAEGANACICRSCATRPHSPPTPG